ncbi:MAG: hypothetical protein AAFU63_04510 [Pseudomonadota bacterium]
MAKDRFKIGEAYGGSRAGCADHGVDEWEWVHTGRAFALAHPMGKVRGWMLAVVAYVAAHMALCVYAGLFANILLLPVAVIDLAALVAILKRSPLAWPLVWVPIALSFPLSLPVLFYWVEGTRPNLIYRHRFERLVRPTEGPADV